MYFIFPFLLGYTMTISFNSSGSALAANQARQWKIRIFSWWIFIARFYCQKVSREVINLGTLHLAFTNWGDFLDSVFRDLKLATIVMVNV